MGGLAKELDMQSLFVLVDTLYNIVWWLILASVVMSWLVAFNIVNINNPTVRQIFYTIQRLTEPLLAPIRRMLPNMGGLDISPIILLVLLMFARNLIFEYGPRLLG
jgi:YggT family protein